MNSLSIPLIFPGQPIRKCSNFVCYSIRCNLRIDRDIINYYRLFL